MNNEEVSGPLASIVVPVWNRPETLARAIASVLAQTEPDVEVIVVDNGSDDAEAVAAIVERFSDARVRLVRLPTNLGPSGGRNAGVAQARGPLVGFLDSDDEFEPTWLAAMLPAFADQACGVVTCGFVIDHADSQAKDVALPERLGPSSGGVVARFQAGTMLVRTELMGRIGGYDEALWYAENTDLGMRLAAETERSGAQIVAVMQPLLRWHRGESRDYTRRRLDAAELMLSKHGEVLGNDRAELINHLAVAAVMSARLGNLKRARRHFGRLASRQPRLRNVGRYLVTFFPPIACRVWRTP